MGINLAHYQPAEHRLHGIQRPSCPHCSYRAIVAASPTREPVERSRAHAKLERAQAHLGRPGALDRQIWSLSARLPAHERLPPSKLDNNRSFAPSEFLRIFGELEPQPIEVAFETTYGWNWFADLLADAGIPAHMAHPLATKAIAAARVKNDAVDAKTLAHLLRTNLLAEAWIAPPEAREAGRGGRARLGAGAGPAPRHPGAGPPRPCAGSRSATSTCSGPSPGSC
jgi:hypothetical protein